MQTHKVSRTRDGVQRAMREASELPQPSIVDVDPEDPAQLLDDAGQYSIITDEDIAVDAQPAAEAEASLDAAMEVADAESEEDEEDELAAEEPELTTADEYAAHVHKDSGELYGVHTPKAGDRNLEKTADQEEFIDSDQGETWLETLGHKAAEYGAEPEAELDVIDDSDEHIEHRGHNPTESGDRPVADKGSGGNSGL
jgi:hypothetical protein